MLSGVSEIAISSGASYVYRENAHRYIPTRFSVRGRDLAGAVGEAQNNVRKRVQLPSGYRLEWSGEFGALQEAEERLAWIIPRMPAWVCCLQLSPTESARRSKSRWPR